MMCVMYTLPTIHIKSHIKFYQPSLKSFQVIMGFSFEQTNRRTDRQQTYGPLLCEHRLGTNNLPTSNTRAVYKYLLHTILCILALPLFFFFLNILFVCQILKYLYRLNQYLVYLSKIFW